MSGSDPSHRSAPTFGIEEEFVLLDPATLRPTPAAAAALSLLVEAGFATATSEFLASQLEFATAVCRTPEDAMTQLTAFRHALARSATELGALAASTGMPWDARPAPDVYPDERYTRVRADIGALIDDHQVCGMHVHVGVAAPEDRVRAINGLRAWIPMLTAIAANSPFHHGADSGFASWRTIVMRRWTTHGIPAPFDDAADYERRIAELVGVGVTRDRALIAWMLRSSHRFPTVEFRFADAQLTAADSVAIALLCRRLVARALRGADGTGGADGADGTDGSSHPFSAELLDAAVWAAARDGLEASVPDPVRGGLVPVAEAVADALGGPPDDGSPDDGAAAIARLLERGTGADRQRTALAGGGLAALRSVLRPAP